MDNLIIVSHYIPILTTLISATFAYFILSRYRSRSGARHLLWWGIGVAVYGAGTLFESVNVLFGWSMINFKLWYISGALLGGAPLAIGTIYLLLKDKAGNTAVVLLGVTVAITSLFVIGSPIKYELVSMGTLNSRVLEWQSIRMVSPFINGLAAMFLIGGAIYSAMNYRRQPEHRHRYIGNIAIAIGGLLPGIGGFYSRLGHTEVLYIGELIGILFIWSGYLKCLKPVSMHLMKVRPSATPMFP